MCAHHLLDCGLAGEDDAKAGPKSQPYEQSEPRNEMSTRQKSMKRRPKPIKIIPFRPPPGICKELLELSMSSSDDCDDDEGDDDPDVACSVLAVSSSSIRTSVTNNTAASHMRHNSSSSLSSSTCRPPTRRRRLRTTTATTPTIKAGTAKSNATTDRSIVKNILAVMGHPLTKTKNETKNDRQPQLENFSNQRGSIRRQPSSMMEFK
mmetsp:Transcript_2632/g.5111  ORF Transcript_2632/g.5111 Transcript_2632/m.5111 type:complete len:207 (-) Transcript_2632:116-736(-)